MRDSFPSEINHKIENKENVVEFAKSNAGKIRNKLPGMKQVKKSSAVVRFSGLQWTPH